MSDGGFPNPGDFFPDDWEDENIEVDPDFCDSLDFGLPLKPETENCQANDVYQSSNNSNNQYDLITHEYESFNKINDIWHTEFKHASSQIDQIHSSNTNISESQLSNAQICPPDVQLVGNVAVANHSSMPHQNNTADPYLNQVSITGTQSPNVYPSQLKEIEYQDLKAQISPYTPVYPQNQSINPNEVQYFNMGQQNTIQVSNNHSLVLSPDSSQASFIGVQNPILSKHQETQTHRSIYGKGPEVKNLMRYKHYREVYTNCLFYQAIKKNSPDKIQGKVNEIGKYFNSYFSNQIKDGNLPKFNRDIRRNLGIAIWFFEDLIPLIYGWLGEVENLKL